jgi:hypothetical protein
MDNTRNKSSQPEQSKSNRNGQPDALADQYNYYYERIYPILKEGKLDFQRISTKTGLKERRVRETLLFRLTSGEVMQLFGRKDGFCYICGYKTHSPANKEPVCISCLKALDTAIQEVHMAEIAEYKKKQTVAAERPALAVLTENKTDEAAFQTQKASSFDYEQMMMKELDRYRQLFGPLPGQAPAIESATELDCIDDIILLAGEDEESVELITEQLEEETLVTADEPSPTEGTLEYVVEVDPLLKMLALDDRDVPFEGLELQMSDLFSKVSIRHFGFQRMKGG